MGINTSKPSNEAPTVASVKKELNTGDSSDPRSPTPEITRTPLHVSILQLLFSII